MSRPLRWRVLRVAAAVLGAVAAGVTIHGVAHGHIKWWAVLLTIDSAGLFYVCTAQPCRDACDDGQHDEGR